MSDCIEWKGARTDVNYGQKYFRGQTQYTHRLAWVWANGPIPPGMCVLHKCDNPPCCNPDHLFLGTKRDNTKDMIAKERGYNQKKTHCPKGHPYSPENTRVSVRKTGLMARNCRTCERVWQAAYRAKKRKCNGLLEQMSCV